jgi:hypothetical protein
MDISQNLGRPRGTAAGLGDAGFPSFRPARTIFRGEATGQPAVCPSGDFGLLPFTRTPERPAAQRLTTYVYIPSAVWSDPANHATLHCFTQGTSRPLAAHRAFGTPQRPAPTVCGRDRFIISGRLGSGVGSLNVCVLLLWPVSLVGILIQAASEEQILRARFGQDYEHYAERTGRLVPPRQRARRRPRNVPRG